LLLIAPLLICGLRRLIRLRWLLITTLLCWCTLLTTTKKFHLVGNNLRCIALLTILLPLTAAETALDIYL
jgi:hypothetical protein